MVKTENPSKARGFTIVEALIGFFVIALGILAVSGLMVRSLEMNADAEARTEALHLAKEKIAGFRDFATKAEVLAYTTDEVGNTIAGDNATFTRTWAVAPATGIANATQVTVDVGWVGVNGAQSVSLTTLIAEVEPKYTGDFLMKIDMPAQNPASPVITCLCTWAPTNNFCSNPPASAVSSNPEAGACCTLDACSGYRPTGNKDCKNTSYSVEFICY